MTVEELLENLTYGLRLIQCSGNIAAIRAEHDEVTVTFSEKMESPLRGNLTDLGWSVTNYVAHFSTELE